MGPAKFCVFCLILKSEQTLKLNDTAYRRLKANRGENVTKYTGVHRRICKEGRKIRRANDEKDGERAETSRPII